MKFSIVVPVYNVYDYLDKCLNSLVNQKYDNFEIIVVNDGSTDNSKKIIDKYKKKYKDLIKTYDKKNGGLSDARNFGIKYATGDYLLFCDSDDYLNKDLLSKLNKIIGSNDPDCVKYLFRLVNEDYSKIRDELCNIEGEVNFEQMIKFEYANSACCYAFKKDFWTKYKFKFEKGKVHEDYGIVPLILVLAKKLAVLNYCGYNYLMRNNSITNGSEKNVRRANDMLYHYDQMMKKVDTYDLNEEKVKLFKSYITNGVIGAASILNNKDLDNYILELKKRNVSVYLLTNNITRRIKKMLISVNMKLYFKINNKRR